MSGFKVFSTGQDLDAIFATRTGTDPSAQLVPFVTPAGQNLSERYYPYNPGDTKAIITRFKFFDTSGNIQDLNDYFRKAPGWSGMGSGTNNSVNAISSLDASNVYVGGAFDRTDASYNRIAKWDGTNWSPLGGGAALNVLTIYALNASNVYVGGSFSTVYSTGTSFVIGTNYIARWDGSFWNALGSGVNNTSVNAIYALNVSNVYVGGSFTFARNTGLINVSGTSRIAKWNGNTWSALGSGTNGDVNVIYALNESNVYVGGSFVNALDANGNPIVGTSRIAKWDGNSWSAIGSGTNGTVNAIDALNESNVYVGGSFVNALDANGNTIAGTSRIAKLDGNSWSAIGSGANGTNGTVNKIDALNASNVYVGGIFTRAGDALYSRIAKWG